jgi:hypothetical protein
MYISLIESRAKGFRRCGYAVITAPAGPRAPWLMPGWVIRSEGSALRERRLAPA